MTWDPTIKAFTAEFKPTAQKMDFEFELSSGLSSYTDSITGYVPQQIMEQGTEIGKMPKIPLPAAEPTPGTKPHRL